MRRIDIFVSSPEDVQAERILVERSIRSIAAEFSVPITVTYSNWQRRLSAEDKFAAQSVNGREEGRSWLYPCFWEYQDFGRDQDYRERIPNTGSYDLVVSILWSRLGTKISPAFVMPDGSRPQSANEYEIPGRWMSLLITRAFPEFCAHTDFYYFRPRRLNLKRTGKHSFENGMQFRSFMRHGKAECVHRSLH